MVEQRSRTGISIAKEPLRMRLLQVKDKPCPATDSEQALIARTDYIHDVLVPRYAKRGVDLRTQFLLLHRAHMKGNEQNVLHPPQAELVLKYHKNGTTLGGVLRSPQLPIIAGVGVGVPGAHFADVAFLTDQLMEKAEDLFPWGRENSKVHEDSIYYLLSAIQYIMALTHPFPEANGRVSEDFTYPLWERRPDLKHTKRYISDSGRRANRDVYRRGKLINQYALAHMHEVARVGLQELGLSTSLFPTADYESIILLVDDAGKNPVAFQNRYFHLLGKKIQDITNEFDSPDFEQTHPQEFHAFSTLAQHLKNCSPTYSLQKAA